MAFRNKHNRTYRPFRKDTELPAEIISNPNRPQWMSLSPKNVDLVFFDLETTGGSPLNSSIIEIGAIKYVNGVEVGRLETLVNPKRHIPHIVQKITGINDEMVRTAPKIQDIFDELINFIGNAIIIAHGAQCDVAYLVHHMREFKNAEFPNFYICTHLLVTNFLPNIPVKNLSGVAEYFGLPLLDAHSALADAEMTCSVFWKIFEIFDKNGFKRCDDIFKIQGDIETIKKLGPGINPNAVENIPTTPGILYLLNSHHEISYITASSNIKKSLKYFTEIGVDRDMNRLIVDAAGFKFERKSNLLESLIQEKKDLKKVATPIDPRKNQNRSESFLQIFIPDDMIDYARTYPEKVPFLIPHHGELHEGDFDEELTIDEVPSNSLDFAFNEAEKSLIIPIKKTRKILSSFKSDKFKILRKRNSETEQSVTIGHLKEGYGYCFGPFINAKQVLAEVNEIIKFLPFEFNSFTMPERFEHLRILISLLSGNFNEEVERLQNVTQKIHILYNFSKWIRRLNLLKDLKHIESLLSQNHKGQKLKSGLCIISNNDFKEFEISIVARGRVVKKVKLPFEEGERLKSSRYFTRLFEKHFDTITSPLSPIIFTDDVCSDIELFSYWLSNKKGEGEWIEFSELAGLYDTSVL